MPSLGQLVQQFSALQLEVSLQVPWQTLLLADLLPLYFVSQVELPKRGDCYALGWKPTAEQNRSFFQRSAGPEFEGPFAFEEVNVDWVELAGKVLLPATCLGKSLFADVLHLVVSESDYGCNALVGAVLP